MARSKLAKGHPAPGPIKHPWPHINFMEAEPWAHKPTEDKPQTLIQN